jgi:hybrid cluster-associated redox disulfide protein
MSQVTKDMIISDVLKMDKGTVPIFLNSGMHCLGCPSSSGESIEDACAIHGIDADILVEELNKFFDRKKS